MDHYKVLGVDENASMEEIKKAYEDKCKKFKYEIKDERRARDFINLFDKAYEEIKVERLKQQNQETILINQEKISKSQQDKISIKKKSCDEKEEEIILKRKKSKSYSDKNYNKRKYKNKKNKDNKRKSSKKIIVKKRKNKSVLGKVISIILKILAFPIVVILSILIFICKIIRVISWIASKATMIAAISLAAIHGYQIYKGEVANYNIFFISAIAFIIGLLLPNIVRILPSILEKINNIIKRYIY